jgi:hypothetical protein
MLSAATPPLIVPIYPAKRAKQFLHLSVSAWIAIALIGQWFFATYVFVLYVFPIVTGNPELVNLSKPIIACVKEDTLANQGSNGNTANLNGPMDIFISFACYGIPMIIAERVFWAKRQKHTFRIWTVSMVTVLGASITLIGAVAAILMMWIPRFSAALN